MKIIKRKTLVDLYRVTGKYWNTGDSDYLDTIIKLAKDIDDKLWSEIMSLADLAVRRKAGINTLIRTLTLFRYEVEDECTI